ncbi:hypothetical protein [Phytoactinopolyspora limicola]|uniref:hypothetical protein n=1 Tax=Phytoactinopolyspora limicola TaxID=2715536 RepID=UPI001409C040|nr:hypothetical protein [Phytoactinopolyspora limicola]
MELSPSVGDVVTLDLTMDTDISARVDGDSPQSQSVPGMRFGLEVTVADVSDDEIDLTFVYDDAGFDGDPMVQDALDALVGVTGNLTVTKAGAFVQGGFDAGQLAPELGELVDQFDRQLADLTIPWPDEPVGVGAEWEVVTSVEVAGIGFCNVASYELLAFDGDDYELGIGVEQQALPSSLEESGVSIEVLRGSNTSSGSSRGALSEPMAIWGTSETTGSMEMKVEYDGETMTQEVESTVSLQIEPRG